MHTLLSETVGLVAKRNGSVVVTDERKSSAWQRWVQHPERLWLRNCIFFIHLAVGATLALYIILMSLTGSLIVYRNELERIPSLVPFIDWVVDLHENLLFGQNGRLVNGIGAIGLTLLILTGIVVWWPGINNWRRALTLNWRASFARFNWDLHSAMGFWGLLFVLMWGLSGFYFAFPNTVNALFAFFDPRDRVTDSVLNWLSLLHFGRFGPFAEAVWAILGLMPALLSISGVFLCCRRIIYKAPSLRPAQRETAKEARRSTIAVG
jgi:uncharacterized iron-regulated membrane protein